MTEGKTLGFKLTNLFFGILKALKRIMRLAKRILKGVDVRIKRIFSVMTRVEGISGKRLTSSIYPLQIPLEPDVEEG